MIKIYAYEDASGKVFKLLANNEDAVVLIEQLADANEWDLLHTYPIEDAARFN